MTETASLALINLILQGWFNFRGCDRDTEPEPIAEFSNTGSAREKSRAAGFMFPVIP